jgi:hypothetical protein
MQQRIKSLAYTDRCLDVADGTLRSQPCTNASSQMWQGLGEGAG